MITRHLQSMRRRDLSPGTIDKRRGKLLAFDSRVGLVEAQSEDVEVFLDLRDLSAKTRYDWISHLHCFYVWGIDNGYVSHDPTARVDRPRLRRQLPRPIDTGDLTTAIQMADPTMRAWLTLMAFAGLRCVEVARLEVPDLLFEDRLLRVHGKGDVERLVPMHSEVERCLRMIQRPSRGRVFRRPRGGGYPPAQLSRDVSEYLSDLGISATAHQLRHWFGTHAYRQSRDLRVVQELLGHASPTTTAIYADWSREEAMRTVDALSMDTTAGSVLSDWPT